VQRVKNVGVFSGMRLDTSFSGAQHWDRHCDRLEIRHHDGDGEEVFTAMYNTCTGVSDFVYYKIDAQSFDSGNGRGGGWKDDPQLVAQFKELDRTRADYASASDYQGCGFFNLDRGHQAPVASFNSDHERATLTNMPTNLSPQFAYLNQKSWTYLEMDMRKKGQQIEDDDHNMDGDIEMITGPLYELPRALLDNKNGKAIWTKLLHTGGIEINYKTSSTAWCPERAGVGQFRSEELTGKRGKPRSEKMSCKVAVAGSRMLKASTDPNRLRITYEKSESSFPVRTPLGYFKLMVLKSRSRLGRRTCAWIMDQVGQCMLVSIEMLEKIAHIDLGGTQYGVRRSVDPDFCLPPGGTLRNKQSCMTTTSMMTDPDDITTSMMNEYWKQHLEANEM
jgi:hypothetical protein